MEKINNFDETDPIMDDFVETQMDIIDRIHMFIDLKFNGSQKALADAMGVSEANVSKMVNGLQNYKLYTLIKLGHALGENIIVVPCNRDHEYSQSDNYINRLGPTLLDIDIKEDTFVSQNLHPVNK